MEVESALQIWGSSVEVNKMWYNTMLCDGDSKSYDSIKAHNVYGYVCITKGQFPVRKKSAELFSRNFSSETYLEKYFASQFPVGEISLPNLSAT